MAHDSDLENKLKNLELEREMLGIDEVAQAKDMFKQGLVPATQQLCHLASYAVSEKLRADCSRYVVERNLGVLRDGVATPEADPFEKLLASVVVEYRDEFVNGDKEKVPSDTEGEGE